MEHFNVFRDNHISKTNIYNFTKLLILLDLDKCKFLFILGAYNSTGAIAIFCFFTVSTIGISQKKNIVIYFCLQSNLLNTQIKVIKKNFRI